MAKRVASKEQVQRIARKVAVKAPIRQLRIWLKQDGTERSETYPFLECDGYRMAYSEGVFTECDICRAMFPRLGTSENTDLCPCHVFGEKFVTKRIEEIVNTKHTAYGRYRRKSDA